MVSIEKISSEVQRINNNADIVRSEIFYIRKITENSLHIVQDFFSDQIPGRTLMNALNQLLISCSIAENYLSQINSVSHNYISRLKQ